MNIDKRRELAANLIEQWTDLSFKEKQVAVEDAVILTTVSTAVLNSARLATKGNWPAAFYNLVLGAGLVYAVVASNS